MDAETFRELLAPPGQRALADATALNPTEAGYLGAFEKLRKKHPPALARAALETVLLRLRARDKHALADRSYYTREALEQASGDVVSRYRAGRFAPFPTVIDLCCGVGSDAIQLALAGRSVDAVDSDPLRLAMAEANAVAAGIVGRVRFQPDDVLTTPLPSAEAAFVDPSRREGERRVLDPERYLPPLGAVLARFQAGFPLAAKIAPGVARADLERYAAEAEFISVDGELRECVLWFGPLKSTRRRATVLQSLPSPLERECGLRAPASRPGEGCLANPERERGGDASTRSLTVAVRPDSPHPGGCAADPLPQGERVEETHTLAADRVPPEPSASEVGEYIFDPDPAVIRADLLPLLADQLGAAPVDYGVAVLTGPNPITSPFADCYHVEHAAPFHAGKLRDYLRQHRIGRVTVLKRAVDLDVNEVTRKLKLDGPDHRHLILTRSLGRVVAVVATQTQRPVVGTAGR